MEQSSPSSMAHAASPAQRQCAQILLALAALLLLASIAGIGVTLGFVMPQENAAYFDVAYYDANVYNVRAIATPCCELQNCDCNEADGSDPSCNDALANIIPGSCDNGYFCCSRRNDGSCRTNVQNQLCDSQCGTCYVVVANVTLTSANTTTPPSPRDVSWEKRCPLGDVQCKDDLVVQYEGRNNSFGYVRRNDFGEFDVGELPPYGGCIYCISIAATCGVLVIVFICLIILAVRTLKKPVLRPDPSLQEMRTVNERRAAGPQYK